MGRSGQEGGHKGRKDSDKVAGGCHTTPFTARKSEQEGGGRRARARREGIPRIPCLPTQISP